MKKENIDRLCEQLVEVAKSASSTISDSDKATSEQAQNNISVNIDNTELLGKLDGVQASLDSIKNAMSESQTADSGMSKEDLLKAVVDACKDIESINADELVKKISSLNFNTSNKDINSLNASIAAAFTETNKYSSQILQKLNTIDSLVNDIAKNPLRNNSDKIDELKQLNISISEVSDNAVDNVIKALPNQLDFLTTIGNQIGEAINVDLTAALSNLANVISENQKNNAETPAAESKQPSQQTVEEKPAEGPKVVREVVKEAVEEPVEVKQNLIVNVTLDGNALQKELTPIFERVEESVKAIPNAISSGISSAFSMIQDNMKSAEEKRPSGTVVQPAQINIGGMLDGIINRLDEIKDAIPFSESLSIQPPIVNVEQNANGNDVVSLTTDINNRLRRVIEETDSFNVKNISTTERIQQRQQPEQKLNENKQQASAPSSRRRNTIEGERQPTLTPPKPTTAPPAPRANSLYVDLTGDSKEKFDSIHKILTEIRSALMAIRVGAAEERRAAENSRRIQSQFGNIRSDATADKSKPQNALGYVQAFSESTKSFGSKLLDFFTSAKVKLFLMLAGLVAVIVAFIWTLVKFPGLREKLVNWMKGVGVKLWEIWTNFWTAAAPMVRTIAITIASLIGLMVFGPWGLLVGGVMLIAGLWPKYRGIILATVAALSAAALLIYFGPIGLLVGVGAAVVGAIYAFRKQIWDGLKSAFSFIGDALKYWLSWPINLLVTFFPELGVKLKNGLASFLSGIPFVGKHVKKLFGGEGEEGPDEKSAVSVALADNKTIEDELRNRANAKEPAAPQMPNAEVPSMTAPSMPMTLGSVNPISNYSSSMNTSALTNASNYAPTNISNVSMSSTSVEKLVDAISKSTQPCTDLLNQIYMKMASSTAERQRMTTVVNMPSNAYSRFSAGVRRITSTTINGMFGEGAFEMLQDLLSPILITLNDMKVLMNNGISTIKEAFGIVDETTTPVITASNTLVSTTAQTEIPTENVSLQKYVVVDNSLEPHTFESAAEYETYMQTIHNANMEKQNYANAYGVRIPQRPEEQNTMNSISADEISANQRLPQMSEEEIENTELSAFEYSSSVNSIKSKEQSTNTVNSEKLVSMQQSIETLKKEGSNAAAKQKAQEKSDDENKFEARMGKLPRIIAAGIASYFDNKELKLKGAEMSPMPIGNDKADPLGIKVV